MEIWELAQRRHSLTLRKSNDPCLYSQYFKDFKDLLEAWIKPLLITMWLISTDTLFFCPDFRTSVTLGSFFPADLWPSTNTSSRSEWQRERFSFWGDLCWCLHVMMDTSAHANEVIYHLKCQIITKIYSLLSYVTTTLISLTVSDWLTGGCWSGLPTDRSLLQTEKLYFIFQLYFYTKCFGLLL